MDVLNQTEIMGYNSTVETMSQIVASVGIAIAIIIGIDLLVVLAIDTKISSKIRDIAFKCMAVVTIFWAVLIMVLVADVVIYDKEPTGRYQYECTIDDSISFNSVMKYYTIIEQHGDIWVLEDK
mgnify:CR=1 FL=1